MKQQLVESGAGRLAAVASAAQKVVGVNCFCDSEPAAARGRGRLSGDRSRRRGGAGRARSRRTARRAIRRPPCARARCAARGRERGPQRHGALDRLRPRRRHHRRVEPGRCASCSASIGRRPGVAGLGAAWSSDDVAAVHARVEALTGKARPAAEDAGRQARPRWPFQRRRADRGVRPRLRLRGGLRRHPPDARPDRQCRARGGRARGRASRSSRARTARWCRGAAPAAPTSGSSDLPVVVGGIIPAEDAAALRARAWRGCSRPRTMRWPRSWPRSSDLIEQSADAAAGACIRVSEVRRMSDAPGGGGRLRPFRPPSRREVRRLRRAPGWSRWSIATRRRRKAWRSGWASWR